MPTMIAGYKCQHQNRLGHIFSGCKCKTLWYIKALALHYIVRPWFGAHAAEMTLHCIAFVQEKWHCNVRPWFGALAGEMQPGSPSGVCQISPLIAAIHFFLQGYAFAAIHFTFLQGYAFVQFTSPFDARSACLGEDAKSLCGQVTCHDNPLKNQTISQPINQSIN